MSAGLRTRLIRIGSTVIVVGTALLLSGSGVAVSDPTSTGDRATYVPIRACQLLDTRPAPNTIGSRSTPLTAGLTLTVTVTGAHGTCSVPTNATAAVFTVTAVSPTGGGGLKLFP